jgi:hypothetical protein
VIYREGHGAKSRRGAATIHDAELASSARARQFWEEDPASQPLREIVKKMVIAND